MGRTKVGVLASGRGTDFQSLVDARKHGDLDVDLAVLVCNGPGAHAQRDAIAAGVKVSGCTIHFVDASVDGGSIILQKAVPVHEDDTEETLAARILEQEHVFLPLAVRLFAEGRLNVDGRRVRIDTRGIKIPPMA